MHLSWTATRPASPSATARPRAHSGCGGAAARATLRRRVLIALASAAVVMAASAQDRYPSRTITLVVPAPAGSGTDIGARLLARDMGTALGATVIVDNKPGANGALGSQAVARAQPDGYTLLIGSATTNAANYAFYAAKLGYSPQSFEAIGGLGASPISLYVPVASPWRDVKDLVADARRLPGRFNCGSGNATTQVACEVLRKQAGIDIVNVPYKGNPQALADVVGGQLSFAFSDAAAAMSLVEGRKLRPLGVASATRNPTMPEAPTFIEQGFPGFEITGWSVVFAPAGLPPAIAERLHAAIRKASDSPESVQSRTRAGGVALQMGLPEIRRFVADEVARWARFVDMTGVKPE